MKTFFPMVIAVSLFVISSSIFAQGKDSKAPTAAELVNRIDKNEVYSSIRYEGEMIIEYKGKRYVKNFKVQAKGNTESFVEFTNPEDRGTKYLKREGRLYVYSPDTESVLLISGHLLKESMMGSDMSYEDTIENETLASRYFAALLETETINGRKAWVVDLTARKKTESYPREKLWIDAETEDVLRMELYALSGAKLKEYNLIRAQTIGERRFPVEFEMRDLLRQGSRTVLKMSNVVLDAPIDDSVFGMRNLQR